MAQTKVQLLQPDLGDVIDFDASTLFVDGADNRIGIRNTNPQYELDVTGTINATNFRGNISVGTIDDWIVHAGDSNTKFGFPANDVISFERAGGEALRITTANAILTAGVTAEPLYPHYVTARKIQAEIKGALDVGQTRHHGSLAVNCTNSNSFIGLVRSDNTQTDGTGIGVLGWSGFDGTDYHQAAAIEVLKGAGAGNDDQPGHMIFKTNAGTTSAAERLRITAGGQVNIGGSYTQTSNTLNVTGNIKSTTRFNLNDAVYHWQQNRMSLGNSHIIESQQNTPFAICTQGVAQPIVLGTGTAGGAAVEHMRIASGGNVGIGDTSPSYKLCVNSGVHNDVALFQSSDQYAHIYIRDNNTHNNTYFGVESNNFRWVTHDGTSSAERFRIGHLGGLGLNTTLIRNNRFLHIAAPSAAYDGASTNLADGGGIMFQPTDSNFATGRTYPGIFWSGNTASLGRVRAAIIGRSANSNDGTDIVFLTRNQADGTAITPADERMRLDKDGILWHYPSSVSQAYGKWQRDGDTYQLRVQKNGSVDTNFAIQVQDGGSLKRMITITGGNKHVAIGPDITATRNLHVQEHFLVANKGTNAHQPYVSSTPILSVGTDGTNVVPSDTTYRHNALVLFGVGGHNAGNPAGNNYSGACPALGYFKLDLYGQTGLGDVGSNLDSTLSIRSINPNNTRFRIRTKDNYNGTYPHASISFTQQQSTEIGRIECLSQTSAANRAHLDFHTNWGGLARRMRIMDTGKILFGNHLHDRGAQFQYEGSEHAGIGIHRNTANHGAPALVFSASRGTSAGSNTVVQSGDYLGLIRFAGTDGSDLASGAQITAIVDGTPGSNDMPTRLGFWVSKDGTESPNERMRLSAKGDLHIHSNDRGWSTIQHGSIRYHCRQHYSNGNFVVTQSLMRVKRYWWGWGSYKIRCKLYYYGSHSGESTFFLNGHGNNDSYSIKRLEQSLTGGGDNHYGGSGLISITSPSNSSPGNSTTSYVDVQINIPNYTYAIIIMECNGNQYTSDPNNIGNDGYCLL